MTLAIAHAEGETAVLDLVREHRPPFSPDGVVQEFAEVLKSYGLAQVRGDRYAGEWPRERFAAHGVTYEPATQAKSDLYREILPLLNAGRVALLDHRVLRAQLEALERRVARGGRDSIDHPPGGRDDLANAAAGALVSAAGEGGGDNFIYAGGRILDLDQGRAVSHWDPFEERFVPVWLRGWVPYWGSLT